MKKSTGIIFVLAVAIAAYVYFYDLKHTKPTDATGDSETATPSDDASANAKPAYSLAATDIATLTVERGGTSASFEQRADGWYMTQPGTTRPEPFRRRRNASGPRNLRRGSPAHRRARRKAPLRPRHSCT